MNRILFAASRGARIQTLLQEKKWVSAVAIRCAKDMDGFQYRIHPYDAHLQYGPISTELRGAAELVRDGTYLQDVLGRYGCAAVDNYVGNNNEFGHCWDTAMRADALHKSLFLLILSESIAEDGL